MIKEFKNLKIKDVLQSLNHSIFQSFIPAFITTVFYFVPHFFPFFTPSEWFLANDTQFSR